VTLAILNRSLLVLAAVLAVIVFVRRAREHRPVAVFLVSQAIVQTSLRLSWWPYLHAAVAAAGGDLDRGIAPVEPLVGWARAVGLADAAAWMSWGPSFAALALCVFHGNPVNYAASGRSERSAFKSRGVGFDSPPRLKISAPAPRPLVLLPLVAWLAVVVTMASTYPLHRYLYPRLYTATQLASVLVSVAALCGAMVRRWKAREGLSTTALCVASIVVIEAGAMVGAHYWGLWRAYDLDRIMMAVMYMFLVLLQGGMLWTSTKR